MLEAAKAINQWIQEAGSTPVAYMTWAEKTNEAGQRKMTEAYREMAEQLGAVLAPVGEEWWQYKQAHPEIPDQLFNMVMCRIPAAGGEAEAVGYWFQS